MEVCLPQRRKIGFVIWRKGNQDYQDFQDFQDKREGGRVDLSFNDQYLLKQDMEKNDGRMYIPAGTVFEYCGECDPENDDIFKLTSVGGCYNIILDHEMFQSLFVAYNPERR